MKKKKRTCTHVTRRYASINNKSFSFRRREIPGVVRIIPSPCRFPVGPPRCCCCRRCSAPETDRPRSRRRRGGRAPEWLTRARSERPDGRRDRRYLFTGGELLSWSLLFARRWFRRGRDGELLILYYYLYDRYFRPADRADVNGSASRQTRTHVPKLVRNV